jgi:hypothetical protein
MVFHSFSAACEVASQELFPSEEQQLVGVEGTDLPRDREGNWDETDQELLFVHVQPGPTMPRLF